MHNNNLYFHIAIWTVFLLNSFALASECYISANDKNILDTNTDKYIFANKTLYCPNSNSESDKDQYKIIRGNKYEIKSLDILASSHGYHLVKQAIDCTKIHCQHINIIPLDNFNPINKYNPKNTRISVNRNTQQMVDLIDSNLWLADVVTLTSWNRQTGSAGNDSAKDWIVSKFNNLSLQTSTQSFNVFSNPTNNIIGVQTGTSKPDDWYIVGAHMDSIPASGTAPGAVDNASGCAGVLEIARIASMYDFASTIIFICYSGEEQGLHGSIFHVNSIINAGNQTKVKAALTMDMIGYKPATSAYELLLETSLANQWLMDILAQNAATYAPNLTVFMSTNPFGSDHMPYINNNMHGILSIDDDYADYPAYHKSYDLPENITLTQGEYILKTNIAALAQLAEINTTIDIIFINSFED